MTPAALDLPRTFGGIDIYLFDQLLRERITPADRIVDAGCGEGRNLYYFLQAAYEVRGMDRDPAAIEHVRRMAAELAPALPPENFRHEPIERTSFPDQCASVVISSAVLHFADDLAHFDAMLREMWRLLTPGGMFFGRLASSVGIQDRIVAIESRERWYRLPDGSSRFLVDEELLLARTRELGGQLMDPLKTTIVQDQRAMTTWVVRK
jgi:SAM-dependent methyltransferase